MDKKDSKKKRLINIMFYVDIVLVITLIMMTNSDFRIVSNKNIINNESSLTKYKTEKFVTVDLNNSIETRFSISDNDKKKSNIYNVNFGNQTLLIELSKSTVITDKVNLMYKKDDMYTSSLKEDINKESDNKIDFKNGYYTNINIKENVEIIKIKVIVAVIFTFMSSLFAIYNLFKYIIVKKKA